MNEPLSRDFEFVRPLRELVRPSDEISEQDEFLPSYNTMDESKWVICVKSSPKFLLDRKDIFMTRSFLDAKYPYLYSTWVFYSC